MKAVGTESGGIAPAPNTPVRASSGAPTGDGKENEPPGQAKVGRTAKSSADSATESSSAPASKRMLKVACYADDPREPELIGEGLVDFASILKKGEYDGAVHICNLLWKITLANKEIVLHIEWVKLENKGKYSGEVFIEMTFYSSVCVYRSLCVRVWLTSRWLRDHHRYDDPKSSQTQQQGMADLDILSLSL